MPAADWVRAGARRPVLLVPPLAFLTLFFALPMLQVLQEASSDAWRWVLLPSVQAQVRIAFTQAALSTGLALLLAVPVAVVHHRYRLPAARWLLAAHAAPFVLPVFVVVYGLQGTLLDAVPLEPLAAVVAANAYYNYGLAARLLASHLERRPRHLEDAARLLGATPVQAFLRTSGSLLAGPAASVALLVFVWTFGSLGVVLLLGAGEVATLETMLVRQLGGIFPRTDRAAVLGILQIGFSALLLALALAVRRGRHLPAASPQPKRRAPRWLQAGSVALALTALVPVIAVLLGGFRLRGAWSLEPWRALLDHDHPSHVGGFDLATSLGWSAFYAFGSTLIALVLCGLLAYGGRGHRMLRLAIEAIGSLPLAASSLLVGFALALAYGARSWWDLRSTATLVLLAHTLVTLPFVCRVVLPAFDTVDRRLEEVAASLGASPWSIARRVHLPVLATPVLAAAGFAVALSLADFGTTVLLMRPATGGLGYWVLEHRAPFDPLLRAQSTALAGLLGVLAVAAYAVTERVRVRA